jgi:spore coat protein U-like protein
MKRILAATTALLGVVVAQNAWADTATASIGATGNAPATCSVTSTVLKFHSITTLLEADGNATVTVTCTSGATYAVGMDYGLHATTGTQRNLHGTTNATLVNYGIFTNSGHTIPWGNIDGVDAVAGTGTGAAQILTVYGQVPSGQTLAADDLYTDTIGVTLTY